MALEQTVKELQAQKAQFQEMILNLTQGQEEFKALLLEIKIQGKNESNAVYGRRDHDERYREQTVGAVAITAPSSQLQNYQCRPKRQFTMLNMTLAQALQGMPKAKLITLRDPPAKPNIESPQYNPNARGAYHSDSPGHDTNDCWTLRNKIQDMIDAGEIEFNPPETLNVITTPVPDYDKHVPQTGLFPRYAENCDFCRRY